MNKRILACIFIVTILLSISARPGMARNSQTPSAVNLATDAPWYTQHVDGAEGNSAGAYPSVAFSSSGIPYVSYYNSQNGELWYARSVTDGSGNCGVGNNWLCQLIDTDGDVGQYSSIDYWQSNNIVGMWKLGISYYDATNRALKLAIYSCTYPYPCEWNIYAIQQATSINQYYGLYSSFKFTSDGVPHIAYHNSYTLGDDELKYAYPATEGGNCGLGVVLGEWQCDSIKTGEGMGQYPSLDVRWDDTVFLAYYDAGNGNLEFAYYAGIGGNCGPSDAWLCTVIDGSAGSDVGLYASLKTPQFSGDKYRIAYHDKTNGQLKIAYTYNGTGNCDAVGWQCDVVDDTSASIDPMGISLTTDESGNPIIAYQKFSDALSPGTLHIAQSAYAMGIDVGNCGDVPPGYLFQYWQCDTIDNASGYTNVSNFASIDVAPSGLAIIAYNERLTDYPGYDILKVAYQVYNQLYLPAILRAP